jgi:hypothetical protein
MITKEIISNLKNSDLYAECLCGGEFKLSEVFIFDGTKPFPPEVKELQEEYEERLKDREKELVKNRKLTSEKALITTKSVNVGKSLEKVLPIMADFRARFFVFI